MGYEKTIVQKANSDSESEEDLAEELHYIYTNNQNILIDLYLESNQLSDEEMDEIADSLVIKE